MDVLGLTIITAPRPFEDEFLHTQSNAILSWEYSAMLAGFNVEIVAVCLEKPTADYCEWLETGPTIEPVFCHKYVELEFNGSSRNVPRVDVVFCIGESLASNNLIMYINPDNILLPKFFSAIRLAVEHHFGQDPFLLIGERRDVAVSEYLDFEPGWDEKFAKRKSRYRGPSAMDFFVYQPIGLFDPIPPFTMPCFVWDGWLVGRGRELGVPVVNLTKYTTPRHQDHRDSTVLYKQPCRYDNEAMSDATGVERCWNAHATYAMTREGEIIKR
jgi:hypothetical protein